MMKNELINKIKLARYIYICGNGGSAATAEHFATDLVKKGYRAFALSANTSVVTMIANDYGYDKIFSKQLEAYIYDDQDLVITISCSGKSKNILKALRVAQKYLTDVYSFETFIDDQDFGKLEDKHLKFAHQVAKAL